MAKIKSHYDIVIIGSGMGGLVAANILVREGKSVCVLEKNNQFGGNCRPLFVIALFLIPVFIMSGGLSKGQNLYRYFDYLGILDGLEFKKLNEDGFDIITFDNDGNRIPTCAGLRKF